jgi:choice-of-anchor B domain-containing protein
MNTRRWIAVAGLVACVHHGPAAAQTSLDVSLLSHLDQYASYAALWGWTSPGGTELVILGTSTGTSIVDVTVPTAPVERAFIPGVSSSWREMKAYDHYAYVVTEGAGGGMQIIDLATNPPALVATYSTTFDTGHTITIDGHYAYVSGARSGGVQVGIRILDLTNPTSPVDVGGWNGFYTHDCSIRGNRLWAACISSGLVAVVDITNKANPSMITNFTWTGNSAHNCELTGDGRYLLTTDEVGGGHLHVFDVLDPMNPVLVAEWSAHPAASIHNVHIRGDLAYISYYTEGMRVVDITDPTLPVEVGYYDTWPGASGGFNGNWEVYPHAQSGNAYLSDISTGLYVVRFEPTRGSVSGTVRAAGAGPVLAGATVGIAGGAATASQADGRFRLFDAPGMQTLVTSFFGFYDDSTAVTITVGADTPQDVELDRLPSLGVQGTVRAAAGGTPLADAVVALDSSPLARTTGGAGDYDFEFVPLGVWSFEASRFGYTPERRVVSLSQYETMAPPVVVDFDLDPAAVAHDFEPSQQGWARTVPAGQATSGLWVWADPVGSGGGAVQPEDDHSPAPGVRCWVTGNAASPGLGVGTADVDNGITVLQTPIFDLSGLANPEISYWRWYCNDAGSNPGGDSLRVDISNDGGTTWKSLEKVGHTVASWTQVRVAVASLVAPTAQMRLRFTAEDLGGGSVVEAAIDDFMAYGFTTTDAAPHAARTQLHANVPNPFNASTQFRFEVAAPGPVQLVLFDVRGRRVRTLIDAPLGAGLQTRPWDGRDDDGHAVASGTYVARLTAGGTSSTRRLQLVK